MSNFLLTKYGGTLPSFNPLTFRTNTILADDIVSNNLLSSTISSRAMTLQGDVSDSDVATEAYVENRINQLLGGASDGYNTLLELQAELQDNDNAIATLVSSVASKVGKTGNESITGTKNFSSIQLNNVDLSGRLNGLDISVNGKLGIVDAQNTYSTLIGQMQLDSKISDVSTNLSNSIGRIDSSLNTLNSRTSAISVSGSTTTINSRLVVTAGTNGNVQLGNQSGDSLSVLCGTTSFVDGSISQNAVNGLSSRLNDVDTSLNNRLTIIDASNQYLKINDAQSTYATISSLNAVNSSLLDVSGRTGVNTSNITTLDNVKANIIDVSNTYARISSLNTTNNNVSSLQSSVNTLNSRTNALNFDASSNTTTINSRLQVTGDDLNNGSVFLGDGSGNDQIFLRGSLIANGQTVSAVRVGHLSTLTGNVQTQLDARAPINNPTFTGTVSGITKAMVGLGNVDNISDISKGISIATQNALDLKADISLVDFKVAQLVNSAPEALNTLNELSQALGNDPNFATSVSTAIGLRALDVSAVHVTGNENISGQKNFLTGITLNGTDLNTRLNGNESNISSLQSSVNTLNSRTGALNFDASSNTTTINSRLSVTGDELNNGSVFLGDGSGNDQIFLRGSLIANGQTVSATRIGHLSTLTGNVQTQLNAKANIVDVSDTYVKIVDASNTYLRLVDASNNYATISNLGVTNTNVTNLSDRMTTAETNISGLQSGKANIVDVSASFLTQSNASSTYATLSSLSSVNTNVTNLTNTVNLKANIADVSASFLTQSSASSTYATQSSLSTTNTNVTNLTTTVNGKANIADVSASFMTLAGNNTITGQNVFNNVQTMERVCEQIHQAGSGTNLSLSFTGIKGIVQYAPSANYTLTLTNVPTSNTNCVYTLTFRYSTKFYANAISVNGTSITMTAVGGLSNLSINASATIVYQTIHIIFNNSSTPTVSTSLLALW